MTDNFEFYIKIFENSAEGLFLINPGGKIKFVNEKCTEITGWSIDEILGNQEDFLKYFKFDNGDKLEHVVSFKRWSGEDILLKYTFVYQGKTGDSILVNLEPHSGQDLAPWAGNVYKHLYFNLPDPVISFDVKGRIINVNPAVMKLLGYEREEMDSASKLYLEKDAFIFRIRELVISKGQLSQTVWLKTKDGRERRFYETIWPHFDSKFELSGFTAHFQDLAREDLLKAQLSASQANYNRLFEQFASSIVIVDEVGNVVNMNRAAEGLYGWSREEMLGVPYDDYFSAGRNHPSIMEVIETTKKQGGKTIDIGVSRKNRNGDLLFVYVTYYLIDLSGDGMFALFVLEKDLTTRIKLEKKLEESVSQVKETQAAAIMGFAKLTEFRDHCTGEHLERIKSYTRILTTNMRKLPEYRNYITDDYIEDITMSSILHDIGKVGIEDSILLKAGKLSQDEFEVMKNHSNMGGDALTVIDKNVGYKSFLTIGKEIASYHHEKWDGSGYPEGLKGTEIPLSARIVALADVYDALISERPYKQAFKHEEAVNIIMEEKGRHFDPDVVDAFAGCLDEFYSIANEALSEVCC